MDRCNVIVVGASAGGVILLMELVAGLPGDLNAAVAVDFIGDVPALTNELVRRTRVLAADPVVELYVTDESNELDAVEIDRGAADPDEWSAAPSQFTCPECHG